MKKEKSEGWGELALYSLIKNPFLLPSLVLHLIIFHFLVVGVFLVNPEESNLSIPIRLLELGEGISQTKSIGPDRGPGGPRIPPKRGNFDISRQSSGKLNAASSEGMTPSTESTPPPKVAPALPGPKVLAEVPRPFPVKETPPDSLVQLPTKNSTPNLASAVNPQASQRSLAAIRETGEGEGIGALKDGVQLLGALKGGGAGADLYGVPGGNREGTGTRGGGAGTSTEGGGLSRLKGTLSRDHNQYLKLIEKRVFSVWKYPDGVAGVQKVSVRFSLDRAGKLSQVEILESTDPRINGSALEAMRKASPFPPIPDSLKDLAGESLIIRFTVDIRIRG